MTEPVNGCVRECVISAVVGWLNLMASHLIFCTILMKDKVLFKLYFTTLYLQLSLTQLLYLLLEATLKGCNCHQSNKAEGYELRDKGTLIIMLLYQIQC